MLHFESAAMDGRIWISYLEKQPAQIAVRHRSDHGRSH
jgi:hypothetical protein